MREELLPLLAYQPWHIMNGMIKVTKPANPPSVRRKAKTSEASLGTLGALPLEILHYIF